MAKALVIEEDGSLGCKEPETETIPVSEVVLLEELKDNGLDVRTVRPFSINESPTSCIHFFK